ncbi:MAG TPA: glucose-6-phosphate dehydrogenase assembly protein OpcA, partial [Isosphaeraceae bacterium]|nr:glucose-6-phosphate dehydrogenase assembly protein OpcA [Isosphaeraceae bacterium]
MGDSLPLPEEYVGVALRDIEKEVSRQLHAEQDPSGPPIQRARMSNVVVYCDEPERAFEIDAQLRQIVASHPSRVIQLVAHPDAHPVEAAVRVRTRYVASGRQEVGSEQILLQAGGRTVDHLPYVVRGLLIGDLPTNLWWASRQPPSLAGALLYDLAEQAQQVIYDSLGWIDAHRGMSAMATWLSRIERDDHNDWRVASDLDWRRLKFWRRAIAQALDPNTSPRAIESVNEVLVEHGPHGVTQAWEIASWMASRLGWKIQARKIQPNVEISWNVLGPNGLLRLRIRRLEDGPSRLRRVRIACSLCQEPGAIDVVDRDDGRIAVSLEGQEGDARTVALTVPSGAELVSRQLTDRDRDPV